MLSEIGFCLEAFSNKKSQLQFITDLVIRSLAIKQSYVFYPVVTWRLRSQLVYPKHGQPLRIAQ